METLIKERIQTLEQELAKVYDEYEDSDADMYRNPVERGAKIIRLSEELQNLRIYLEKAEVA